MGFKSKPNLSWLSARRSAGGFTRIRQAMEIPSARIVKAIKSLYHLHIS